MRIDIVRNDSEYKKPRGGGEGDRSRWALRRQLIALSFSSFGTRSAWVIGLSFSMPSFYELSLLL
jgi:hypothetical protein